MKKSIKSNLRINEQAYTVLDQALGYCPHCHFSHKIFELERYYEISIPDYMKVPIKRKVFYCTSSVDFSDLICKESRNADFYKKKYLFLIFC